MNKIKHTINRLTHALNEKDELVNVIDVPNGSKCNCKCPACKEPLVAKNKGEKRISHFAHKSGTECEHAVETMLHLLAKEKIQKAFLENSEYWIEYEYKSFCKRKDECKYNYWDKDNCFTSEIKRYNLKDYYDSCEQEKPYDNINRRSDLKIFSKKNPNREPIYLEFCVTHASDAEKIKSDNKIIEIRIENEEDIINLSQGITASKFCCKNDYKNIEKPISKISFNNFKDKDNKNENISQEIDFIRFSLFSSGKMTCQADSINCEIFRKHNLKKKNPNSLQRL